MAVGASSVSDEIAAARSISLEEPWSWLAAGWRDLTRMPALSLSYGVVVAAISVVITWGLFELDAIAMVLPLAAGFMLVGPMLAVGLYESSRRQERGLPLSLADVLIVKVASPTQLALMGGVLCFALMVWWRIASLLFALFYGLDNFPPLEAWIDQLLFTPKGLIFLTVGTAIGGLIAAFIFTISAVSVPLLMARRCDAVTAILTSIHAVRGNPRPMLLWAWLIALLTGFGIVTLYIGLIVVFPLLGHATWHAYRALVPPQPDA